MEIIVAFIGACGTVLAASVPIMRRQKAILEEIKPRDSFGHTNGLQAGEVLYKLYNHVEKPYYEAHPPGPAHPAPHTDSQ